MIMIIMTHTFDDNDKTLGSTTFHRADFALLTLAKEDVDDNDHDDDDDYDDYDDH